MPNYPALAPAQPGPGCCLQIIIAVQGGFVADTQQVALALWGPVARCVSLILADLLGVVVASKGWDRKLGSLGALAGRGAQLAAGLWPPPHTHAHAHTCAHTNTHTHSGVYFARHTDVSGVLIAG